MLLLYEGTLHSQVAIDLPLFANCCLHLIRSSGGPQTAGKAREQSIFLYVFIILHNKTNNN